MNIMSMPLTDEAYEDLKKLHKLVNPNWRTQHTMVLDYCTTPERAEQVIADFRAYLRNRGIANV